MIDFLRGKPAHVDNDYVVLDVNGVGYRVFCANPYAIKARETEEITMFIHQHVREDAIQLFGFLTRAEQSLFRRLLDVTGIGPRMAVGILAAGKPDEVVAAIYQENVHFLMKLPGIGKKTAQRIILDLKDKLADLPFGADSAALTASASASGSAGSGSVGQGAWGEARQALLALGYSEAEADRAWAALQGKASPEDSVDKLIKQALQVLFKAQG